MIRMPSRPTYVSLFSSAGLGCYGFKLEGFDCLATAELLPRRMAVQRSNNVCADEAGYIVGDLTSTEVQSKIMARVATHLLRERNNDLTALIATPPCQGMSVANHKKQNELPRNSLVVESLKVILKTRPRYFILENVRSFLKSICLDIDGNYKPISQAIDDNLLGSYNVEKKVVNLKDFGSPSSRTRTLVVGVRRDIPNVTPEDIFPCPKPAPTLQQLIGHLPSLKNMGEASLEDPYHSFRPYAAHMRSWIAGLPEGASAFANPNAALRPHRIVAGVRIENKAANGDKYRRNVWDKVAPCVHTRNDILASQSTVHPEDDRVFSIRELMLMMGVPSSFNWFPLTTGNESTDHDLLATIRSHEPNIRQCLGEGVPTPVFRSIAKNINETLGKSSAASTPKDSISSRLRSFELSNPQRKATAAYYTRLDIAADLVDSLPTSKPGKQLRILEPSGGAGAFLPSLLRKYDGMDVAIDLVDIDETAIAAAKILYSELRKDSSPKVRFITADFLHWEPTRPYDVVVGNPPFGNPTGAGSKAALSSENLYVQFLKKCLTLAPYVALIIPKAFMSAPAYRETREKVSKFPIVRISDYGESAFLDIKIETIGLHIDKYAAGNRLRVLSYPLRSNRVVDSSYVLDPNFPSWLIYRNDYFDSVAEKLDLGIFNVHRDRTLTKSHRIESNGVPLLRARNIGHGELLTYEDDCHVSPAAVSSAWQKLANRKDLVAVPNLSYYPRATIVPAGMTPDGSAAILIPNRPLEDMERRIAFFSSREFFHFYRIARNYSTRSLNVDSVAAYFWGLPKSTVGSIPQRFAPTTVDLFTHPSEKAWAV